MPWEKSDIRLHLWYNIYEVKMRTSDPDFVKYIESLKTLPADQKAKMREHLLAEAGIKRPVQPPVVGAAEVLGKE